VAHAFCAARWFRGPKKLPNANHRPWDRDCSHKPATSERIRPEAGLILIWSLVIIFRHETGRLIAVVAEEFH
jgi:hypothetical protein